MIKCLDKKRLVQRGACLNCPLRFNKCRMSQELIDSNIFLRVYLEENGYEKYLDLLNKNKINYIGFVTTIQVSHIIRRFNEKMNKLESNRDLESKNELIHLNTLRDNFLIKLKNFVIIDFNENDLNVFKKLEDDGSLRMEFHDKINVGVAIMNKLNLQAIDIDLIEDFQTIENISLEFGHKIRLNTEY